MHVISSNARICSARTNILKMLSKLSHNIDNRGLALYYCFDHPDPQGGQVTIQEDSPVGEARVLLDLLAS